MKAFRTLRRGHFDANCMMVTAAFGAVLLQEFDEAASVSFLFSISEFLEDQATKKARLALDSIVNMRPDHANLIDPSQKTELKQTNCHKVFVNSSRGRATDSWSINSCLFTNQHHGEELATPPRSSH